MARTGLIIYLCKQAGNVGDGLGSMVKKDGVNAEGSGTGDGFLDIIKENDLLWLHLETLTRDLEDALVRLGDMLFIRIDDEIGHLIKMELFRLSAACSRHGVAQDRRFVTRTLLFEELGELLIQLILLPNIVA